MTTIAYRDGILAADSRYTEESESGGDRMFQCRKIFQTLNTVVEGYLKKQWVALAGDESGLLFLRWVKNGMDPDNKPEFSKGDDFSALVVTVHGGVPRVEVYGTHCEPEAVVESYHAIGSGAKCAFVAMDMGTGAFEAVERAAVRDPWTGGPITAVECVA